VIASFLLFFPCVMAGSCPSDRDLRISFCEFSSGYHHERINVTDKISLVVIIIIVIIIVIIIIVVVVVDGVTAVVDQFTCRAGPSRKRPRPSSSNEKAVTKAELDRRARMARESQARAEQKQQEEKKRSARSS